MRAAEPFARAQLLSETGLAVSDPSGEEYGEEYGLEMALFGTNGASSASQWSLSRTPATPRESRLRSDHEMRTRGPPGGAAGGCGGGGGGTTTTLSAKETAFADLTFLIAGMVGRQDAASVVDAA